MKTDRQRRIAGHLRGVFGPRMAPGEPDEPVATGGEIYIKKRPQKAPSLLLPGKYIVKR